MQLIHAFENHEHNTICTSKNVKHIYPQHLNCDIFHKPHQNLALNIPLKFDIIPKHFYEITFNELLQVVHTAYQIKKSPRGPPFFIV